MSKSDAFETALNNLIFNNANIANIGDATGLRGSVAAGSLFLALHTADPGEAGTQSTNEISYTGYARVAVARTAGGWTVAGNTVSPTANIDFGAMTGGTGGVATHASIGVASSGAGMVLYKGALNPVINVANGVTPRIGTGSAITED